MSEVLKGLPTVMAAAAKGGISSRPVSSSSLALWSSSLADVSSSLYACVFSASNGWRRTLGEILDYKSKVDWVDREVR